MDDDLELIEPEDEPEPDSDVEAPPSSQALDELRGLVAYLATNLVDEPAEVDVQAEQRGSSVLLSLRVPERELGKVIGRQGRIARAMRTVVMISAARYHLRASLDIEG